MANAYEEKARLLKRDRLLRALWFAAAEMKVGPNTAEMIFALDGLSDKEWAVVAALATQLERQTNPEAQTVHVPSDATKRMVRAALLRRLPLDELTRTWGPSGCGPANDEEVYELSADDRALLREMETAKAIATHDQTTWGE